MKALVALWLRCGCAWVALWSLSERSVVARWFLGGRWQVGGSPEVVVSVVFPWLLDSMTVPSLRLLLGCSGSEFPRLLRALFQVGLSLF